MVLDPVLGISPAAAVDALPLVVIPKPLILDKIAGQGHLAPSTNGIKSIRRVNPIFVERATTQSCPAQGLEQVEEVHKRFRGTTMENALSKVGRSIRNMVNLRSKDVVGCRSHDKEVCISCMCHIDIHGKTSKDGSKIDLTHKVDEPPKIEIKPAFGDEAKFDPAHDLQVRSKINAEAPTQTNAPAYFTTPSRRWFSYCSKCGVTYLAGTAGPPAAADHPSHAATEFGKRSICVYVDAGASEDGQGTLVGDSSVFFGPKSKYNALTKDAYDLNHERSIQISALRRAMRRTLTIMDQRKSLVEKEAMSNSHKFLWVSCTQFRLLIFSRMEAVNSRLDWNRDARGQDQFDPQIEADLLNIDEDVTSLASQGIEVRFFSLPAFHSYEPEYELFYDRFI